MSDRGKSKFPDLSFRTEVISPTGKTIKFFLVCGDIFEFVGDVHRAENWMVDAMLVSTNVELDFASGSPAIQRRLRQQLPAEVVAKISSSFGQHRHLNAYDQSLAVDTQKDFSPRAFAFVATDRRSGGTYNDSKWQAEHLDQAHMARRINSALSNLRTRSPRTIVTPLVGASQVNLDVGFLEKLGDRVVLRERMQRSISGILKGFEMYLTSKAGANATFDEVAIIVWPQDVERVIPSSMIKDKSFLHRDSPGGYLSLQMSLVGTFKDALIDLDRSLRGVKQ